MFADIVKIKATSLHRAPFNREVRKIYSSMAIANIYNFVLRRVSSKFGGKSFVLLPTFDSMSILVVTSGFNPQANQCAKSIGVFCIDL
jgi:hypothetical protein